MLFIADEVICGFGRTGNMFGTQTYKLQPDIITVAKALSSAYLPIAAVMINQRVYDVISEHTGKLGSFAHGFTYSGHPVSAAVALETLKIYEERDIVGQVRAEVAGLRQGHSALQGPSAGGRNPQRRADRRHRAGARQADQGDLRSQARRRPRIA